MAKQNPMDDFEKWFDQMSKQLEEASRQWSTGSSPLPSSGKKAEVDIIDRGDEFVVTMDLPGYTKEAITAKLTDDTLFVDAEREGVDETKTEGEENYIRMERSHESISRRVRLPEPVDPDAVDARMNNGVLTVTLEKKRPSESSKSIDIE